MCLVSNRTRQESIDLTTSFFPSLEAEGWTPPSTAGGTWCRVSPDGIYEIWPKDQTRSVTVRSDSLKALFGTTKFLWKQTHD